MPPNLQFYLLLPLSVSSTEYFSSFAHLRTLQNLESALIKNLKTQIENHRKSLDDISAKISEIEAVPASLDHPISQYKLIKRMSQDFPEMIQNFQDFSQSTFNMLNNITNTYGGLPGSSDLDGTAEAVLRLQDTYKIETVDFANGNFSGYQSTSKLTTEDCFHIGQQAYFKEDYYHTILWMRQAYYKYLEELPPNYDEITILDYLSFSFARLNYRSLARKVSERILSLLKAQENPNKELATRIAKNIEIYTTDILEGHTLEDDNLDVKLPGPEQVRYPEYYKYESLCRQTEPNWTDEQRSRLFCFYHTQNNNPRLILKPAKAELLSIKPTVVLFHQTISDEETEFVKNTSLTRLTRATVQNPQTGNLEFAEYRVSKHAWLKKDEHEIIARINQRFEDYSGLSTKGLASEDLQVGNYGVGGQYEPHQNFLIKLINRKEITIISFENFIYFDMSTPDTAGDFGEERGNRVATILVYFNDVPLGGNTVFVKTGLRYIYKNSKFTSRSLHF